MAPHYPDSVFIFPGGFLAVGASYLRHLIHVFWRLLTAGLAKPHVRLYSSKKKRTVFWLEKPLARDIHGRRFCFRGARAQLFWQREINRLHNNFCVRDGLPVPGLGVSDANGRTVSPHLT